MSNWQIWQTRSRCRLNSGNLLCSWCFTYSVAPVLTNCHLSFRNTPAFSQDFRYMTRKNTPIDIDSSTKYFAHDDKRVRDDSLQSIEKWSQHSSRCLESWSKLGSKRSFDRLKNHTLQGIIIIMSRLPGLLSETQWKDAFQLEDFLREILKDSACTLSTPIDEKMSKQERAEIHVLSDRVMCWVQAAMNEASEKIRMKCADFLANEIWFFRWKIAPATNNCETFEIHVLCLPWRCRRWDQLTDPIVTETVWNIEKLYTQCRAHIENNPISFDPSSDTRYNS